MKRLFALLMVLALMLGLTGTVAVAEEEPTVITVAANGAGRADRFKNEIFREIERRLNIKFEINEFEADTFNAMLASNELSDIVLCDGILSQVLSSGLALDITPYIDEYAPNLKSETAAPIFEIVRDLVCGGEGIYVFAAPAGMHNVSIGGMGERVWRGYALRWDYYLEAGMPEIHNDDDFIAVMQKMLEMHPTNEEGTPSLLYGVRPGLGSMGGYTSSFKAPISVNHWSNYQYKSNIYTNEIIDGYMDVEKAPYWYEMAFLNKIYRMGLFDMDCFTMTGEEFDAKCEQGLYMGLYQNNDKLWNKNYALDPETKKTYMIVPSDGMNNYSNVNMILGNLPGNFSIIWKDSPNIEKCMQVFNLMYDLDFMRWVYSGDQGVHWDYDENGVPHMTEYGIESKANGDAFWSTDEGAGGHGERWWHMFGYNPATKHTDGYPLDLAMTRDVAIAAQTPKSKLICDAYGVEYYADAYEIEKDYRNDLGEPISSTITDISTADKRILAECDSLLEASMATLIMSETDEEFEANKAEVLEALEELGEPEVFQRYKEKWDASKEIMMAKHAEFMAANGYELYPVD